MFKRYVKQKQKNWISWRRIKEEVGWNSRRNIVNRLIHKMLVSLSFSFFPSFIKSFFLFFSVIHYFSFVSVFHCVVFGCFFLRVGNVYLKIYYCNMILNTIQNWSWYYYRRDGREKKRNGSENFTAVNWCWKN